MSGETSAFWTALCDALEIDRSLTRPLFDSQLEGSFNMPYRQQRFVSVADHDDLHWDVFVELGPRMNSHRFSVIIPKTTSRSNIFSTAVGLAVYVRHSQRTEDIFVRRDHIIKALTTAAYRRQNAARIAAAPQAAAAPNRPDQPRYNNYQPPAPDATAIAKELLRSIDPELLEKIDRSTAFYFSTPTCTYIWYPSQRAIVSLDDDMPHYVCIHSRDHAVETNTYDWAITMRTYLLGAEQHWRAKANFHRESFLRGGVTALAQRTVES